MLVSNANTICPRLLDYFAIVGCQNAAKNIDCLQDPQILRCYPQDSHSDFELPKEVVYFCQPEGCVSGSVSSLNVDRTSFVFTLTEKDSGTVRFGISLNFYRTCSDPTDCIEENHSTVNSNCQNNAMDPENYAQKTALTSLCIISHYPFFSKFRECLHMIEHILEAGNNFFNEIQASSRTKWTLWDLFVGKVDPNTIEHPSPIIDLFHEIEFWILRLLSTPAPLPGKSCIQLSAVPEWYRTNPLVFALPDKTRLSLIDFPLHLPLELLGVETCLKVLTAIMLERKVILQSRDYNALTMSVMAFSALLYPLQYMFPAIPLLPNSLAGAENLLLSPTPYLIGIPATFLNQKKGFLIPSDVWLVDLDTNRMMGSKNIEPITPMPPLEGKELVEHLEQALSRMHSAQTTNANSETPAVGGMEPEKIIHEASDDVDVVDVATRVAMVQFFNSPNVLANLSEHTRTVRLYPRPVVAFQYYSFLKSRQDLTPFIRQLAKTQAVEFLSEWSLYPENEVFQRIYAGITNPELIGDKAKWFSNFLPQIYFRVWTKATGSLIELVLSWAAQNQSRDMNSSLGCAADPEGAEKIRLLLEEFDYAKYRAQQRLDFATAFCPPKNVSEQLRGVVKPRISVRRRKKTRPPERNSEPDRESEQYGSVPDDRALASQFTFDQSNLDSSNGSSSDLSDTDIWDLTVNNEVKPDELAEEPGGTDVDGATESTRARDKTWMPKSRTDSLPTENQLSENKPVSDSVDTDHQVDPRRVSKEFRERLRSSDLAEDTSQFHPDGDGTLEEELEETSVGKLLLTNLSENLAEAASQATSTLSDFIDMQKNMVNKSKGFARKVVSELKQDTRHSSSEAPVSSSVTEQSPKKRAGFFATSKNLFGFAQNTTRNNSAVQEGSITPAYHTSPDQSIKDQEFLRAVVQMVKEGRGATYSTGSHLRDLLTDENYRSYLISKINSRLMEPVEDPECSVPDFELLSENVYRSFVWLAQCMIRGLEQTCTNHGIGGLASAMSLLEICHTHFVELQPDQRKNNNSQMMMDKRGDSKQHEEHFVDNLNSKIGSKIASQMAGIFFKANRLIGASEPKQNQADPKIASEPSKLVRCVTGANDVESESDSASSEGRSNGHQYKHSAKTISNTDSAWSVQKNVRKSRSSGPYRFVNGELISCNEAQTAGVTGTGSVPSSTAGDDSNRVYLYEALVQPKQRSRLWDHMQFWEDTFFDTVAQERDMMGFDQAPMAMLEKFSNLSLTDKRVLQYQEDRLLATCLYNLIACMVLMRVDRNAIRTRVRRIQARCRLGSHFSLVLSHLLDQLEHLEGNAIDLLPSVTRCNCEHTFIVRKANVNGNDDPKLFEIYKNCIVVRDLTGAIADRLDRSSSPGVMLSADERLVVITMKRKCVDAAESYQSDQAKQMYDALKRWLESKPGEPHKS